MVPVWHIVIPIGNQNFEAQAWVFGKLDVLIATIFGSGLA
jgi:hypothetical protein